MVLYLLKGLFKKKVLCFLRASNMGAYWLGLLKLNGEAFAISAFEGVRFLVCAHIPSHVNISHIYRKKQTQRLKS